MTKMSRPTALWTAALLWAVVSASQAGAMDTVALMLKDNKFTPAAIEVPAGQRFRIEVTNQDATPAEFESAGLRAEKIVVPGGTISVMAGPLKPGTYAFFDEYHPDTAKGSLIASEVGDAGGRQDVGGKRAAGE